MNNQPDPIERFLVNATASLLRIFLTPAYYLMRSDMGIQWSALLPLLLPIALHICAGVAIGRASDANAEAEILYALLVAAGYLRNSAQAEVRRRVRDWSVHSWSTGVSLLDPVLRFTCPRIRRRWGSKIWVRRLLSILLKDDFIYYVGEPAVLTLAAVALWSIGSTLAFYPILLAVSFMVVRNRAKLHRYLRAHEVMDGQMEEREIRAEIEAPTPGHGIGAVAQIPPPPTDRPATDSQSVFQRLSPELQLLLMRNQSST